MNGHYITIPALLIPHMYDDWGIHTIHDTRTNHTTGQPTTTPLTITGYDINEDNEICALYWTTGKPTHRPIYDPIHELTDITVWVPEIPEELANELA